MDGKTLKDIRVNRLFMTQRELARALGYAHKIRISEFERVTNPVPIPRPIANAVLLMGETPPIAMWAVRSVRKYERRA